MCRIVKIFITGLLLLVVTTPSPVWALAFNVNVNTASLAGTAAVLAFDFIDGDNTANNTVQISNFLTDGTLGPGSALLTGDVVGSLGARVNLGDNDFFSEFLQPITLGNSFQFRLETTNAFAGGTPDSFSLFILGSNDLPLFATTDSITGADALFALDLNGMNNDNLSVFKSKPPSTEPTWSIVPVQNVPEPGVLSLILISGWSVYLRKKHNKDTEEKKSENCAIA